MVHVEEDFILRLIKRAIRLLVQALMGKWEADPKAIVRECEEVAGLSVDVAMALDISALTRLLSPGPRLDHGRLMVLGLGLIHQSTRLKRENHPAQASQYRTRGLSLLVMALEADPTLITDDTHKLLAKLTENTQL